MKKVLFNETTSFHLAQYLVADWGNATIDFRGAAARGIAKSSLSWNIWIKCERIVTTPHEISPGLIHPVFQNTNSCEIMQILWQPLMIT